MSGYIIYTTTVVVVVVFKANAFMSHTIMLPLYTYQQCKTLYVCIVTRGVLTTLVKGNNVNQLLMDINNVHKYLHFKLKFN